MHYASDTCDISNLPIYNGDRVVIIPLIKSTPEIIHKGINATDNFIPFAFPIFAEYGEFNEIHNAHTIIYNQKFLLSMKYFNRKRNNQGEYIYETIDIPPSFNDFVYNLITTRRNLYTSAELPNIFTDGYAEVNVLIMHYDLYFKLMTEVKNRKLSNKNKKYGEYLLETIKNQLYDFFEEYHQLEEDEKNIETLREESFILLEKNRLMDDIMNHVFHSEVESNTIKYRHFVNLILDNRLYIESLAQEITNIHLLTSILTLMRKGYLSISGLGSDIEETRLHILLAEFIRQKVEKIVITKEQEDPNYVFGPYSHLIGVAQPITVFLDDIILYNDHINMASDSAENNEE